MIPVNNSSDSHGCSNTSSNCVIWQGPDISCINLCTGDSVSDVVAKIAQELCNLITSSNTASGIEGINLDCIVPSSTPTDINDVVQAIIDHVCGLTIPDAYTLPTVNLPSCLHYDDGQGGTVTALQLDLYAVKLADEICSITTTLTTLQTTVNSLAARVTVLENCVLDVNGNCIPATPSDPVHVSSCIITGTATTSTVSAVLTELEARYCGLETAVGTVTLIGNTIAAQCLTGSDDKLATSGTYPISTPTTLAATVENLWIVVCDLYDAIKEIQLNCCPGACDSIVYDASPSLVLATGNIPTSMVISYAGSSVNTTNFSQCPTTGSVVTIQDLRGGVITQSFNLITEQNNTGGINIAFPSSGFSLYNDFRVVTDFCVKDVRNGNLCTFQDVQTVPSALPCPIDFTLGANNVSITVGFTNYLPAATQYTLKVVEISGGTTIDIGEKVLSVGQGVAVSHVFSDASTFDTLSQNAPTPPIQQGSDYNIVLTIDYDQSSVTCTDLVQDVTVLSCTSWSITGGASGGDPTVVTYQNCSNQATTVTVPASTPLSVQRICVYNNTTPLISSGPGSVAQDSTTLICPLT